MPFPWRIACSLWPWVAVLIGLWWLEETWVAILLYHAPIAVGLVLQTERWGEVRKGFQIWPSLAGLVVGVLTVPSVIIGLPLLVGMSTGEVGNTLEEKLIHTGLSIPSFWLFFGYFVIVHPILEELGWRSFLHSDARGLHGLDLAFASYHLIVLSYFFPSGWLLMVVSFLVLAGSAWLWRQMRKRFGGLASVILVHAAADAGIMVAVWWLAFAKF